MPFHQKPSSERKRNTYKNEWHDYQHQWQSFASYSSHTQCCWLKKYLRFWGWARINSKTHGIDISLAVLQWVFVILSRMLCKALFSSDIGKNMGFIGPFITFLLRLGGCEMNAMKTQLKTMFGAIFNLLKDFCRSG